MKQAKDQDKQANATVKEFKEALEDGRLDYAWRIYRDNPDLQTQFDKAAGIPLG